MNKDRIYRQRFKNYKVVTFRSPVIAYEILRKNKINIAKILRLYLVERAMELPGGEEIKQIINQKPNNYGTTN